MLQVYVPHAPLSHYIECLWYINDVIPYQQERILPTATIEMMLNFGAPFRVYDHDDNTQFSLNRKAWIAGLHTDYIINEPVAETHMMGIRVKPYGLSLFVDVPAYEFHNQIVDMDLLWGNQVESLRQQLYDLPTPQDKFRHLEHILMKRLLPETDHFKLLAHSIQKIRAYNGQLAVRDLCHEIAISNKHLIYLFKRLVGVSPKALSKVYRFQSVLNQIQPNAENDWSKIANMADFYDQSHFNREFAAFTGMSPTQYITYRQQIYGDNLQPGESVHFVPIG